MSRSWTAQPECYCYNQRRARSAQEGRAAQPSSGMVSRIHQGWSIVMVKSAAAGRFPTSAILTQYRPGCSVAVTWAVEPTDTLAKLELLQAVPLGVPSARLTMTSGETDGPPMLTSVAVTVPDTTMLNE